MTAFEAIIQRQSVRAYADQPVPPELIQQLLAAAFAAPSANNSRPWEIIVVTDQVLREQLSQTHTWSGFIKHAPLVLVMCGNPRKSPGHWLEDVCAAIENVLLAAPALGLASCWVAARGDAENEREDHVRAALGIPSDINVVALLPIGYPASPLKPRSLRLIKEAIHRERW